MLEAIYVTHSSMLKRHANSERAMCLIRNFIDTGKINKISLFSAELFGEMQLHDFEESVQIVNAKKPRLMLNERLWGFFAFFQILIFLRANENVSYIFVNGSYARNTILVYFIKLFVNRRLYIIADVCEFYDKFQFTCWFLNPFYFLHKLSHKYFIAKFDGVIAISSLIESFYRSHSISNIVRVPAIIDSRIIENDLKKISTTKDITTDTTLSLAFCGSLGNRKESIYKIIDLFLKFRDFSNYFRLYLIGISEFEIRGVYNISSEVDLQQFGIYALGRLDMAKARSILATCHYSLIVRDDNLNSKAGFPSKFTEALSLGVGIIANDTSDLFDVELYEPCFIRLQSLEEIDLRDKLLNLAKYYSAYRHELVVQLRTDTKSFYFNNLNRICFVKIIGELIDNCGGE